MRLDPTPAEIAGFVAMKIAEYGAYTVLAICLIGFGVATGWLS